TDGTGTALLVIDEATVARAVELARYYRAHALAVFGLVAELPGQRRAQVILSWLRARPATELATLTVRDVHRSRGKGTTAAQLREALGLLEAHGYVRLDRRPRVGSAGRATERVHVHPELAKPPNRLDKPATGNAESPNVGFVGSSTAGFRCAKHPGAA